MRLYRLASRRHARRLDGAGNRDSGARWNSGRGRGIVYTSLNVSTCVLETLVHFGPSLRTRLPRNIMLVEIEAPDDAGIETIEAVDIPDSAARVGADGRTWFQRTGDAWLERGEALILLAPSLVSRRDRNAMLNPAHPRMKDVRILHVERFRFDPRLALSGSEGR
jgi:RES domain-containing protein